jgi:leader peptidase (prepilin peptidase)/N-methyltransferase
MAASDIRWRILPDGLTLALLGAGIAAAALGPPGAFLDSAAGAAGGYAAFAALRASHCALRGAEGMGLGDCKLAAALGAWLGWAALPWVVLAASGAALAVAGASALAGAAAPLRVRHPFGAYLCAAGLIAWSGALAP